MTMTSAVLQAQTARGIPRPGALELLVSRLAMGMLRWSLQSSERRFESLERSVRSRDIPRDSPAADYSHLVRFSRLG